MLVTAAITTLFIVKIHSTNGCSWFLEKKSHSFINGSNPFTPILYTVDLWTANFTGIFPQHWTWCINGSAHFPGRKKNSLEAVFHLLWQTVPVLRKFARASACEACETRTVLTMHHKQKHQLPPSSILKHVYTTCTSVLKVNEICLAPQTKNILMYLYFIFMMSPHIANL